AGRLRCLEIDDVFRTWSAPVPEDQLACRHARYGRCRTPASVHGHRLGRNDSRCEYALYDRVMAPVDGAESTRKRWSHEPDHHVPSLVSPERFPALARAAEDRRAERKTAASCESR